MAHIVMVVAPTNFRDEECFIPKKHFETAGHEVTIVSTKRGTASGMLGGIVNVDKTLAEVSAADYDAVVFVGGSGTPLIRKEEEAIGLAQEAAAKGKVVAAICWAPTILAKAGVLKNKNATVWLGNDPEYGMETNKVIEKFGGKYISEGVVVDGKIVTADGPSNAKQFAEAIAKLLR
ncbi:MAG: DJ-1/PfpI family protein [Candidatus Bilamarchaeaceae archaeon]